MQYITLNNGVKIPSIGLGTYGLCGQKSIEIIQNALHIGYRLFDTAQMYENEKEVLLPFFISNISLKILYFSRSK
ncbi:hypothetical protein XJ32_04030 [Helicobacter bilis]|uniref:NADP-dependent oxidoreductase domain-containing protein n=1 Tax=Helicobacter bilis TaxID=37372 RepID=A0A1Q2LGA7_9HELI|nr:aldo/keto reductase [Helicobacter bilis]AQQ59395.1 hypothetical protein XJ32_04030 [Helicobacter bilis]